MTPSLLDLRFLVLLSAVCVLRQAIPARHLALFGALSSAAIVGIASPVTLLVICGLTLLYLYPVHLLSVRLPRDEGSSKARRAVLATGVGGLVALLIFFKAYQRFTIPFLSGTLFDARLASLIGFSYFLFRAIDFLHVQHLVARKPVSPSLLLFYTLFPPTLTSGPIHRFRDFQAQLTEPTRPSRREVIPAAYRITRGYFRKLCLAFLLNGAVLRMLGGSEPGLVLSLAITTALYLFFYFDFAGYSDIAIGFGGLLGVRVPENFNRPFTTSTLTEFWRHWHITLVDWFRDHVFIPLGGMRAPRRKTSALALLVMILVGLWHGLTWPMILWGLWHGVHMAAEGLLGIKPTPVARRGGTRYWLKVAWTNGRVALASVLFLPNTSDMLFVFKGLIP